ncbi:MAG: hypothetical protein AB8I08_37170 [Sandaracinaceae bacterium]
MNRGLVSADDIVDVTDIQAQVTPKIGKVALWTGALSMAQVWQVLAHQVDHGGLFGAVAVELGLLTEDQRDHLVAEQLERRPGISDLLIERGYCDADAMRLARRDWQTEQLEDSSVNASMVIHQE